MFGNLKQDGVASSFTTGAQSSSVFYRSGPVTTTVFSKATCTFGTNKVTFTWEINDVVATRITLWAIGGSDITNVKAGQVTAGVTTTGTKDYTGLGFDPSDTNSVLFVIDHGNNALETVFNSANSSFGCATSSSKQWNIDACSESGRNPTDIWRIHSNNKVINNLSVSTGV